MDWPETKCLRLWFGLPVQGDVQMKNKGKIKFKKITKINQNLSNQLEKNIYLYN